MFSTYTTLFAGEQLENVLEKKLYNATHAFEYTEAEELDDDKIERAISTALVDFPTVLRAQATITPTTASDSISAELRLPITGNVRLLEYRVGAYNPRQEKIQLTDHLNWSQTQRGDEAVGGFTIDRKFRPEEGPAAAKAWASELVDWVEQNLQVMRPLVEAHNARVRAEVPLAAGRRRTALQTADEWKDAFGTGI